MSQGKTVEKALANAQDAIRAWLKASMAPPVVTQGNVLVTQVEV